MEQEKKDALVIAGALQRLNRYRLPRVLSLKEKVDGGGILNEFELKFLSRVFDDARDLNTILERNPEYLELRAKAVGLCEQILEKSADNEIS